MNAPVPTLETYSRGLEALLRELGPVGYVRFLQLLSDGNGDYTAERQQASSVAELAKAVREASDADR